MPDSLATNANLHDVLAKHRYQELDGLRGVAAIMVAINHGFTSVIAMPGSSFGARVISVLAGIVNGGIAVDLFFIMSGFFLAGMLENPRAGLSRYYARRLIRLIPPAMAAVVILFVYARIALRTPPAVTGAATDYLQFYSANHAISFKSFLLNLLLVRHTLNPPLWTIRIEILTSILFPLVMFIKNLNRAIWYRSAILLALLLIAACLGDQQKRGLDVFQYLYLFYAGILIRDVGGAAARHLAAAQSWLLATSILALALIGALIPTNGLHPIQFDVPVALFGALLINVLAHGRIKAVSALMQSSPVQFLGRVSYSFYLISWLTIYAVGDFALKQAWPQRYGVGNSIIAVTLLSTILGLLAAYGLHVAVERPSVALSRKTAYKEQ